MSKNDKSSKENLTNTEDSTNKANNNSKNKVAENNSVTNSKINKEKNSNIRWLVTVFILSLIHI